MTEISFPIKIHGLSKVYRGKKWQRVAALRQLELTVRSGEIFGFLGPNGAGKSTTIKTLVGLIRPTEGRVTLFGQPAGMAGARQRVGYLPENPAFPDTLTGREFLALVAHSFGLARQQGLMAAERVLDMLDLTTAAGRPIRSYSKGMVQRLGLAQTLLHDPDLYILDEPMSGLDPIGRALVKDIILDLKAKGKTVFFSTHVTADVERVCDRIGVIVGGVLQAQRDVAGLLREGVEGYFCRVSNCPDKVLQPFGYKGRDDVVQELFVPRDRFNDFASQLFRSGGSFDLVEPQRRDIENYFLSLVRQAGEL
ncbi:ABC transporter ATP-binding protein [Geothermobacter hydrogeniphilus]|uniref:ABC transporter ATP-binding protein n=1 Tax=Geothermobacter hydrogeniphilus TaxID=1969733 RepID=A0A2K2H7H2_9BACT|nr:ABC transporter ATP-binding protein [Geothermobacter hydrogeniphilus]PNU19207.1 ABC transporter ATP-binding protein [Geothermobacter hydrogeniphilus]